MEVYSESQNLTFGSKAHRCCGGGILDLPLGLEGRDGRNPSG